MGKEGKLLCLEIPVLGGGSGSVLKILLLVTLSALDGICELCMIYMRLVFVSKVTSSLPAVEHLPDLPGALPLSDIVSSADCIFVC